MVVKRRWWYAWVDEYKKEQEVSGDIIETKTALQIMQENEKSPKRKRLDQLWMNQQLQIYNDFFFLPKLAIVYLSSQVAKLIKGKKWGVAWSLNVHEQYLFLSVSLYNSWVGLPQTWPLQHQSSEACYVITATICANYHIDGIFTPGAQLRSTEPRAPHLWP